MFNARTIGAGLTKSRPGETLLLSAGVFQEELRIDRAIVIQGEDSARPVVRGTIAVSRGIGWLVLHNLDLTLASLIAVEGVNLTLRKCRLNGVGTGIDIAGAGAALVLDDCEITGMQVAVRVRSGARAAISRCRLHGVTGNAFWVDTGASASIADSEVSGSGTDTYPAMALGANAHVDLLRCRILGNTVGMQIFNGSAVSVTECEFRGNTTAALHVNDRASVTIRQCRFIDNDLHVNATGNSAMLMEQCEVQGGNGTQAAVAIQSGATATIRDSKIHDAYNAIVTLGSGAVTIENCELWKTKEPAIWVNSAVVIKGCKVHDVASIGMDFEEGASGTVEDCEIWECQKTAVAASKSTLTFHRLRVHDGPWAVFLGESKSEFEDCEFWNLRGNAAISVERSSTPKLKKIRIHDV
jgi:hypothetical protein